MSITNELRRKMDTLGWYDEDGNIVFTTSNLPVSEIACLVINSKTFDELCDRIDAENAKLREELEAAKHDLSLFSGELVASKLENAKLRELVRDLYDAIDSVFWDGEAETRERFKPRMTELGIEVDEWATKGDLHAGAADSSTATATATRTEDSAAGTRPSAPTAATAACGQVSSTWTGAASSRKRTHDRKRRARNRGWQMNDVKLWIDEVGYTATITGANVSHTMPLWAFEYMREIIVAEAEKKVEVTHRDFDIQQELLDRYRAENAKLRELCKDMMAFIEDDDACERCGHDAECVEAADGELVLPYEGRCLMLDLFADRMRELGIEVDV